MKNFLMVLKFTLFSISAGIVQAGLFTLLNEVLHWWYWLSYLIALVASVVWNFTFNRKFTFKSSTNVPIAMLKVLAYYAVFTPLTVLLEYWLADRLGWNEYLVTGMNMALNFVTEFLYQRYFVFKDSIGSAEEKDKTEDSNTDGE